MGVGEGADKAGFTFLETEAQFLVGRPVRVMKTNKKKSVRDKKSYD